MCHFDMIYDMLYDISCFTIYMLYHMRYDMI